MILQRLLPAPDAAERHAIEIAAPPDVVWRELLALDLGTLTLPRVLMTLRALPALLLGRAPRGARGPLRIGDLEPVGFGRIAEEPGREIVLGVAGSFWRPTGNLLPFDRASFDAPVPSGLARALWSFELEPLAGGGTRLVTETRVCCGDARSRRRFRLYWMLVRPGSGLIRRRLLAAVRRRCR